MLSLERQQYHLQRVSRTFALTIPLMAGTLADCVANAYLICRIADTVEDDPRLANAKKISWLRRFAAQLDAGFADDEELLTLQDEAAILLKEGAVPEEYELCCELIAVMQRTRSYDKAVQHIIGHGAALLSRGMAEHLTSLKIENIDDVDSYCYSVAGVVGELLALLFAHFDARADKEKLLTLSVSFGEGLQLTNILKDRAADDERQVSFLPAVQDGMQGSLLILHYCKIAQGHLKQAGEFTCALPSRMYGVRAFCLLNTAMAVLTLKKIEKNPLGKQSELKISRRAVKWTMAACALCARSALLIKALLWALRLSSPILERDPAALRLKVSAWLH